MYVQIIGQAKKRSLLPMLNFRLDFVRFVDLNVTSTSFMIVRMLFSSHTCYFNYMVDFMSMTE